MIYLASPYTTSNRQVRQARLKANAELIKFGFSNPNNLMTIYSPIIHGDATEQHLGHEVRYNDWIYHGLGMLAKADKMYVACLPGWNESKGVLMEIEFARKENIPVVYLDEDNLVQHISKSVWSNLYDN